MRLIPIPLFLGFILITSSFADDWPQWRGPDRNAISKETGLLQEWPAEGPSLRWKASDIGTGYSAPIIVDGRVYLQTTRDDSEYTIALDEKTGEEIWATKFGTIGANFGPQYPDTRSTPTFNEGHLYCVASGGEIACLKTEDGSVVWSRHLKDDFDGFPGAWAYSESLLVDGDTVVCTPGGDFETLVGLDKANGELKWKSDIDDVGSAEYASVMVAEVGGVRQYIQFVRKGVVGVEAGNGKFLWVYTNTESRGANILTPIVLGDKVFSAGGRSGGGLIQLVPEDGGVNIKELYFNDDLKSSIGGVVLVDGNLYGTSGPAMYCADFETGEVKWKERVVGEASICYADGRLYVRGHNDGAVALVEPSPDGLIEKGRLEQVDRSDTRAWPHPVVANGGLYLRDMGTLLCYDISHKDSE